MNSWGISYRAQKSRNSKGRNVEEAEEEAEEEWSVVHRPRNRQAARTQQRNTGNIISSDAFSLPSLRARRSRIEYSLLNQIAQGCLYSRQQLQRAMTTAAAAGLSEVSRPFLQNDQISENRCRCSSCCWPLQSQVRFRVGYGHRWMFTMFAAC